MWTAVKIAGLVSGILLTIAFIAILILVTRPAVLLGVDGDSVANSVAGHSGEPACRKLESDDWRCYQLGSPPPEYRVEVDWMGCWKATRLSRSAGSGDPKRLEGCIDLDDIVALD